MSQELLGFATIPDRKVVLPKLMYPPRGYQASARDLFFARTWAGSPGCLLCQCTGTGKTMTGCCIMHQWLEQGHEYHCMVVLHERQLFTQFADCIEKIMGITPGREAGADFHVSLPIPRIIVAMRQSLGERVKGDDVVSRLWKYPPEKKWLLIFDEGHRYAAHLKQVAPILSHFKDAPRLLMTATPERGDKTSLATLAPTVIADYPHTSLDGRPCAVKDGWVVDFKQKFVTVHKCDFAKVTKGTDFDADKLSKKLSTLKALDSIIKPTMEIVQKRKTLVFVIDCDMSRKLVARWNSKFEPGCAKWIDSSLPNEQRNLILKQHQDGEFQFLCVVGLCREGYDDPTIGAVVCARPTRLASLAEQMRGRGCRPLKGILDGCKTRAERLAAIANSEKPHCIVVDLVGTTGLSGNQTCASILARGVPDHLVDLVAERANLLAKSNDSLSTREVVKQSLEEIEAEQKQKEERLQAERERLHEEREEIRRLDCVEMDVEYIAEELVQGQGTVRANKQWDMKITKGPHKGMLLSEVPIEYIERCVYAMKPMSANGKVNWYRQKMKRELDFRRPPNQTRR